MERQPVHVITGGGDGIGHRRLLYHQQQIVLEG